MKTFKPWMYLLIPFIPILVPILIPLWIIFYIFILIPMEIICTFLNIEPPKWCQNLLSSD